MRTYVLWDIDNTLLYTGGAGSLGMRRAFRDLYGVDDAFGRVEFSGRTDTAIFTDAAHAFGIDPERVGDEIVRFLDAYIPHLRTALDEVDGALMPGISATLEALASRENVVQGLGTGNFRRGGELKLRHYGIDRYFPGFVGGFGEDSPSRDEVIRIAIERLTDGRANGDRVVVIGDTPHDVTAAHANGAYALAVATGRNPVEELIACGADTALEDLSDIDRVLAIVDALDVREP
ncbi:MAG TPA: HAD family hydrolase [Dehalococcoidia bacterium]|nr:HAD family hydrolase [Dehalococcoidia bacterium]